MKILVLADAESTYIWDHFDPDAFADVDLVISCGDLKASYLSFVVTMLPVPLLYVPGNHDADYLRNPPLGCDLIDDQVVTVKGLRIMGLGGSYRYKPGPFQQAALILWLPIRPVLVCMKRPICRTEALTASTIS